MTAAWFRFLSRRSRGCRFRWLSCYSASRLLHRCHSPHRCRRRCYSVYLRHTTCLRIHRHWWSSRYTTSRDSASDLDIRRWQQSRIRPIRSQHPSSHSRLQTAGCQAQRLPGAGGQLTSAPGSEVITAHGREVLTGARLPALCEQTKGTSGQMRLRQSAKAGLELFTSFHWAYTKQNKNYRKSPTQWLTDKISASDKQIKLLNFSCIYE